MGARIWSTCLGIYITEFTSVRSRNLWTVSSWVCRETLESKPRGEDPPPTWEASFRSMLTLNDPRLRQNTTENVSKRNDARAAISPTRNSPGCLCCDIADRGCVRSPTYGGVTTRAQQLCLFAQRVLLRLRSSYYFYYCAFAIRQCAAWSSTLITQKHFPKEENQGKPKQRGNILYAQSPTSY